MNNLSPVQWACIAGAAGMLVVPRLGGIKDVLAGSWAKIQGLVNRQASATAAPSANDIAAAYKLLEPMLDAPTATAVRQQVGDMMLRGQYTPLPTARTEARS